MKMPEIGKQYVVEWPGKPSFAIQVEAVSTYMVLGEITCGYFDEASKPTRRAGDGVWLSTRISGIEFVPVE